MVVFANKFIHHRDTSLIEAARFGYDEVVTALLMAKADMRVKNDEGKTGPDVGG